MNEESRLDIKDSLTHQLLISQPSYVILFFILACLFRSMAKAEGCLVQGCPKFSTLCIIFRET